MQLKLSCWQTHVQAFREAAALHGVTAEPDLNAMLRMPGVMSMESGSEKDDAAGLEAAVLASLGRWCAVERGAGAGGRGAGGGVAGFDGAAGGLAAEVGELRGGVRDAQFERLRTRMAELLHGAAVSEERLLAEAALLAERSDVEEEMVRLRTHVERFWRCWRRAASWGSGWTFCCRS